MEKQVYTKESTVWTKLYYGELIVKFIKKDGTERTMRCTLNLDKVPEELLPKGTKTVTNDLTKRVFDLDKNAWRSFRYDSVVEVNEC